MRSSLFAIVLLGYPAAADDGWQELLISGEKSPWKKLDNRWIFAKDATLDSMTGKLLVAVEPGMGPVWLNGVKGRLPDLITNADYRDVEVHLEFMLGKGSNSGIKFHAVYEIQLRDATDVSTALTGNSMGGIYPKATHKPKYTHLDNGIAPMVNAAKPAGQWQMLEATFRSPRFNIKGEKTENARLVKAVLNGKVIHENVELKHPTGANYEKKEVAAGPFMIQADHGPTAVRNVKIREIK